MIFTKQQFVGLSIFILLTVLFSGLVLADGPSRGTGSASSGIVDCFNSQSCLELDKIWVNYLVGKITDLSGSRSTNQVYNARSTTMQASYWDDFYDVHPSERPTTSSSSGSSANWIGACYAVESSELSSIRREEPSISEEVIDHILEEANSPAAGSGKHFISYGKQYGIDPAFALAVFQQESNYATASTSRADERKSLGNIRCPNEYALADTTQTTEAPGDSTANTWCAYDSWENSIKGWYNYITESNNYFPQGRYTIEEIIPVYAPSGDGANNPGSYVSNIQKNVQKYRAMQGDMCSASHGHASCESLVSFSSNAGMTVGSSVNACMTQPAVAALQKAVAEFKEKTGTKAVVADAHRSVADQADRFWSNCYEPRRSSQTTKTWAGCSPITADLDLLDTHSSELKSAKTRAEVVNIFEEHGDADDGFHTTGTAIDIWTVKHQSGFKDNVALMDALQRAMENHGFCRLNSEKWHFDYKGNVNSANCKTFGSMKTSGVDASAKCSEKNCNLDYCIFDYDDFEYVSCESGREPQLG